MTTWLKENLGTIVVAALLIVIVLLIIKNLIKNKKNGIHSSCGNCRYCSMCETCQQSNHK